MTNNNSLELSQVAMIIIVISFSISGNPSHIYFCFPAFTYLFLYHKYNPSIFLKRIIIFILLLASIMLFIDKHKLKLYNPFIGQSLILKTDACFLPVSENNSLMQFISGDCRHVIVTYWQYKAGTELVILKTGKTTHSSLLTQALFYYPNITEFKIIDGEKKRVITGNISAFDFQDYDLFTPELRKNLLSHGLPVINDYLKWPAVFFSIYLLHGLRSRNANERTIKYSNTVIFWLLILVAGYFVLITAANDGFSGSLLGIPYYFFLAFFFLKSPGLSARIAILILIISASALYLSDLSRNKWIYPIVGTSHTLELPTEVTYGFYLNHIRLFESSEKHNDQPVTTLPSGTRITVTRQLVSGHPDFATKYLFELNAPELDEYLFRVKSVEDKHARFLWQNYKFSSSLYSNDYTKVYVTEHDIDELFAKPMRNQYRSMLNSITVYFSLYPLIYFPVLVIFTMLCIIWHVNSRTS